ncbi:MAG: hypothetical protein KAR40_13770 [Candidatus Sabulitectum sp.]|nr:hypothetical protein [Candidatus Sabulitectum sp.]
MCNKPNNCRSKADCPAATFGCWLKECYVEETVSPQAGTEAGSAELAGYAKFDREEYIEKLWTCYQKGIGEQDLPAEDLFKALINDLLEQIVDGKTVRA